MSAYIPTNVISITDGQIFLETELFFSGQRPAVNAGISVSRVGGNAQTKAIKKVSSKIKMMLAQYRELANFAQFGSDVDADTKVRLDQGEILMEVLRQGQYRPLSVAQQVFIIYAATHGYLSDIEKDSVSSFERQMYTYIEDHYPQLEQEIEATGDIKEESLEVLGKAIVEFKKVGFING